MNGNSQNNSKPDLEELFDDLAHPNPYIVKKSYLQMLKYWQQESLIRLLVNLNHQNISIRRNSVKAISAFGVKALPSTLELFYSSTNKTVRTSCLKILVKIAPTIESDLLCQDLIKAVEIALEDDSPEIILTGIQVLRQLGVIALPSLISLCKDENILKVKAAITAISEFRDPLVEKCFKDLLDDELTDKFICQSILEVQSTMIS